MGQHLFSLMSLKLSFLQVTCENIYSLGSAVLMFLIARQKIGP